jgi:hypothetical protein
MPNSAGGNRAPCSQEIPPSNTLKSWDSFLGVFACRVKKLGILSRFMIFSLDVLFGRSWQNYSNERIQGVMDSG